MKYKVFVVAGSCLIVTGLTIAAGFDATFNPRDKLMERVPTGHVAGKDNSTMADEHGTHMAGEDCGICHTPGGKADPDNTGQYVFTMAGTLYEDKAARKPLAGGEVILQDSAGNVISMTSNEVGNFWTYAPLVSYPYAVSGHGSITKLYTETNDGNGNVTLSPGDKSDPRSWLYKVWVKKGDQVIQSPDIKPIGGSGTTTPRMGCGMHHAPTGSRGALWLSEKGTLASYPETGLSFKKHVQPILMSKCASCHRPGATTTRLVMKSDIDHAYPNAQSTQIDFSGAHDLTAYDDQSVTVGSTVWSKHGTGHYAEGYESNPEMSDLLLKTVKGGQNHAGGTFWTEAHPDYQAIRQWISEGAPNN